MEQFDVIVIGAGAAGMMCAAVAGARGRKVALLDNGKKPGRKIIISGGGRCNFTNYHIEPAAYLCSNPHFVKSALKQYSQWDFIGLVSQYGIPFHEKTLGQLFCDNDAHDIVTMLQSECDKANVVQRYQMHIEPDGIAALADGGFSVVANGNTLQCQSLVIATGGLSMPKLGATPFGYKVAEHFGLKVLPTRAGLVPFTLHDYDKARFAELSGVAVPSVAQAQSGKTFKEALLFTHRGLSGPSVLQISSYWLPGEPVHFDLLPELDAVSWLLEAKAQQPGKELKTVIAQQFPKRLAEVLLQDELWPNGLAETPIRQIADKQLQAIGQWLQHWPIKPNGTEGYRTAEVTLGGVDTDQLSSKTMECKTVAGLYFVGEVMDVSGWLGGYNFQWAWSSGYVAGKTA